MSQLQLFAVNQASGQPLVQLLPLPPGATSLDELYAGLTLGVYTHFRTYEHNKFLGLADHLERTAQSARLAGLPVLWDEKIIRRALQQVCTAYPAATNAGADARVRIDLLAEPARSLGSESSVLIALAPFTPIPVSLYAAGVTVGFAQGLLREQPLIKTASFVEARKRYPLSASTLHERLLVNAQGEILEGLSSNFYGVINGMVRTAGAGVLEGITRKLLLSIIHELGLPLRMDAVRVDELDLLEEAAISSSSRGWLPVVNIAGTVVGAGQPGPVSQRVRKAYDAYVAQAIQPAVNG